MTMNWKALKDNLHQVGIGVALFLILLTGLVVDVRLMRGDDFPENYDTWIWALVMLAGVNVAGIGVIRATGVPYAAAKAGAAPSQVIVAGDASVQTAAQPAAKPAVPQAGVKPSDPAIVAGLEASAANQQLRDADGLPFKGVPDDATRSDETGGLG